MKSTLKYLFIFPFISLIVTFNSCKSSQPVIESNTLDENRTVYWFNIYISFDKVEGTDIDAYEIWRKNDEPEKGTAKQYDYLFWKNLSEGTKFSIGPFNNETEAKKALHFYKIQKELHTLDESYNKDQKVFWFVLKIKKRERSKSWELVRIPGAVASGKYSQFDAFLRDQLKTGVLTIGPFNSMPDAEEAKRVYRLH